MLDLNANADSSVSGTPIRNLNIACYSLFRDVDFHARFHYDHYEYSGRWHGQYRGWKHGRVHKTVKDHTHIMDVAVALEMGLGATCVCAVSKARNLLERFMTFTDMRKKTGVRLRDLSPVTRGSMNARSCNLVNPTSIVLVVHTCKSNQLPSNFTIYKFPYSLISSYGSSSYP